MPEASQQLPTPQPAQLPAPYPAGSDPQTAGSEPATASPDLPSGMTGAQLEGLETLLAAIVRTAAGTWCDDKLISPY